MSCSCACCLCNGHLHNACRQCTTPMHVADTCRGCMHATDVCIPPLHAYCQYMYAINTCVPAVHAYRRCMHTIGACIPPKHATNKRRRGMPPTYATNAYCKCMPPMLLPIYNIGLLALFGPVQLCLQYVCSLMGEASHCGSLLKHVVSSK